MLHHLERSAARRFCAHICILIYDAAVKRPVYRHSYHCTTSHCDAVHVLLINMLFIMLCCAQVKLGKEFTMHSPKQFIFTTLAQAGYDSVVFDGEAGRVHAVYNWDQASCVLSSLADKGLLPEYSRSACNSPIAYVTVLVGQCMHYMYSLGQWQCAAHVSIVLLRACRSGGGGSSISSKAP